MKRVYLLGAALFAGLTANSQQINEKFDFSGHKSERDPSEINHFSKQKTKNHKKQKAVGDTIWSEDFANGIGSWTASGDHASVWIYDLSGPGGTYTDVNISTPDHGSTANQSNYIIVSPTADNGFADFIADEYNTINPPYTDLSASFESPVINLTGITAAELTFFHKFRVCCSSQNKLRLEVSTDDFVSSVEVDVMNGVAVNTNSGTVDYTLNLSGFLDTATNKSNFKMRFNWAGLDTYFWQIDDIAIKEVVSVDVELTKLYVEDIFNVGYEQTNIPQSLADTLNLSAIVTNYGGATIPSNTSCEVRLYDADSTLINSISGGVLAQDPSNDLWINDTLYFYTGIDLSALEIGSYRVEANLVVPGDANASNDTLYRTFNITDGYLGQTNFQAGITTGNEGYFQNSKVPFTYGNTTYIPGTEEVNLHGVEILLVKTPYYSTTPNTTVVVNTYEVTFGSDAITYTDIQEPREFTIADTSLPTTDYSTKSLYLNFNDANDLTGPVSLSPNKYYLAGIYHAGGTDSIAFGKVIGDADYSSRLNIREGATSGAFTWYWLGDQGIVDMVLTDRGSIASLEENSSTINVSNIFPNPTTGETSVTYNLANASKVSVKVMDITGKIVYSENESNKSEGKHTLNINATAFNSGVYYVTIATDEAQVTKKLIKK